MKMLDIHSERKYVIGTSTRVQVQLRMFTDIPLCLYVVSHWEYFILDLEVRPSHIY